MTDLFFHNPGSASCCICRLAFWREHPERLPFKRSSSYWIWIASVVFRCPVRLADTRPCLRFHGVVLDTRQSPIWIKRRTAALGAVRPALALRAPENLRYPDRVQVAWDAAQGGVRSDSFLARRRMRLVQSFSGSRPGRIQYIPTASKRGCMRRMKECPFRKTGFSAQPVLEFTPSSKIMRLSP